MPPSAGQVHLQGQPVAGLLAAERARRLAWLGQEMAGDPAMVPLLLGLGVDELSCSPPLVPQIKKLVRQIKQSEAEALVNRMGFNSQGAPAVAERLNELRAMSPIKFPIGINIGKNRDTPLERAGDDYVRALEILYGVSDYLVINLSSPNTPGLTDLQEAAYLQPLLRQVREARDKAGRSLPG